MNTTFTTCAEKKAKQFLNLLQGYTKGIRTTAILILLLMGVSNMWADGGIGYKGVKFTKNGDVTGWYNIHNVSWDYAHSSYECRSGKSGVTNFNNADLGIVTSLKLHSFVVIGWRNSSSDYVAGQLKYRLYKQSASAGNYSTYNVGNYGNNSWGAYDVLIQDGDNRVVGKNGDMDITLVDNNTAPGQYYLQLQGLGRMQWTNGGDSGSFNDNNGSEVKAQLVVPGFTTTSKSQTFDNTQVNNSSSKTISFGTHYGTALKTSNCSISGTNASEFSVTSINESGVTVQFKPTSAGDKSATLTITDVHSKTCTITLSGNAQPPTSTITISTEKTYLRTAYDKLTLNIYYLNIPEGYTYRVHATPEAYFNGNKDGENVDRVSISGNGKTTFVSHGYLAPNTYTVEVILWNNNAATNIKSNQISIIVEPQLSVQTRARFNNQISTTAAEHPQPEWVYPSQNIGETITANNPNQGYTFAGWRANDDNLIEFEDPNSLTTIVKSKVNGYNSAVAYADYVKENCVYFINTSNWSSVYAYAWNGDGEQKNAEWPGVAMTKTGEKIGGFDIYKYCTRYDNLIFSDKGANQTGDLVWEDGKYYCTSGVHGNFFANNEWKTTNFSSVSNDRTSASLTLNINAGSYEFGMKVPDWISNSSSFSRENNSHTISGHTGNCNFNADVTGEYTFTWTFATNTLTITYPQLVTYTVTFDMKGHGTQIEQIEVNKGSKIPTPTAPTATGYSFGGWYKDANCNTVWNFNTDVVTEDLILYAKWTINSHNVTWKANGGNWSGNTNDKVDSYNYGATITKPTNPTRTGYNFAGWSPNFNANTTMPDEDLTYTAQWTEILSTITITTNPAEGGFVTVDKKSFTPGNTVQVGVTTTCTVTTTANEGYGVIEWGVSDGNIVIINGGHTVTLKSDGSGRDGTLTARYTPISRNIQFDKQSGEGGTDKATVTYTQNNYSVSPVIIPTRAGYTFGGYYSEEKGEGVRVVSAEGQWLANATDYTDAEGNWLKSAENTTLYAKWTAKQYTITLDNQDATTAGTTSVTATYDADMPSATMPTKTGYHFDGYYTETNGGGTQYYDADGTSAKNWDKTSNTTLYAYFQKAEITGIAFETGEVPEGGYVTFEPTIEPTPSGNTVICWELKKGETTIDNSYIIPVNGTNKVQISIAELVANKGKGIYTIKATLRTGTGCESGTELSSYETNFANTDFILSTPIYLKPGLPWKKDNARFAVYYWGNGGNNNGWVDMNTIGCSDEYYAAEIPIGYSDFKFVRLNPEAEEYGWGDDVVWGQTENLSIPNDGKNLYDMSKKLHLNRGTWSQDQKGRYAVYFFKEGDDDFGNAWVDLIAGNENDVYYCDVPSNKEYPNVIFCRMDPDQVNGWDNNKVWHQTSNLSLEDGNYFTITSFGGDGNNAGGNWTYIYTGEWSTLNLPTITITNENKDYGSISVKTIDGTEITSGMEVDWDTEVIVSIQPEAGYAVASSEINIGGNAETIQSGKTYTICGNTTINISFEEKSEYYIIGIDGNWDSFQEKYKFIDGKVLLSLKKDGGNPSFKIAKVKGGTLETRYGRNNTYTFKGNINTSILSDANSTNDHCVLETVHDGDYLFVWDENTKTLTIEYPNVIFLHGDFNGWKDKASHALHDRDAIVYLTAGSDYEFKVAEKGTYYTANDYTTKMTKTGDSKTMNDGTNYNTNPYHNCTVNASVTGLYTFHFDKETRILTITYPTDNTLAVGDYRLHYTNDSKNYYTDHVKKRTSGDGVDTVSLFILNAGTEPRVILQQCTNASGNGTWETVTTHNLSDMTLDNEMTDEHGGVWNFIIAQTDNGVNATVSNATNPERYTGKYYIRTDAADGGWNEYPIPENEIFFSSYARDNEGFDYYYCKYIGSGTNVKYNIANDYNSRLNSTDYDTDALVSSGSMPADGNVRFMWNSRTNELVGRAYLDGSSTENFLRITNATNLYDADGKNSINEIKFTDLQNWIYQVDVQANTNTQIKLKAIYNGNEQFFKGDNDNTVPLLTSNNTSKNYKIRLIYNFKTNHLVCAWLGGDETITTDEKLTADMMIIRRDQEQAEQLSFNPNTKQLDLKGTAYAVMTFTKAFIQNETYKERQRSLYWVSFPFDVKISDVFGFGEYGEHWILQYYDGVERAKKGLFIDSGTYWKYITNTETILKKGVGYVLALDLNKVQFLHGVKDVSLYFPSTGEIGIIKGDGETTTMEVPAHQCTITHGAMDRTIYDSHWNLIGIPGFTDPGMIDVTNYNNQIPEVFLKEDANLGFHYEFDLATNTYNVKRSTVAFKTMYSYLVQYNGTMEWNISAIDNTPAQIAARRNSNSNVPEKVSLRLEIAQNEQMIDQTFVQLQQEKATAEFDMNLDLTKIINSGANIYTLAGTNRIQTAGNTLPMENATVPVGVVISKAGEYTFRMPDGTDGIMAELIDYETNTTTNLLYDEYTVNLTKGTFENRFALFVRPNNTATSLENINGESTTNGKDVRKVLIDNILYIIRDGQMFDARGARVQ